MITLAPSPHLRGEGSRRAGEGVNGAVIVGQQAHHQHARPEPRFVDCANACACSLGFGINLCAQRQTKRPAVRGVCFTV